MQGLRYMLLGVAIMVLGQVFHGYSYVPYLFYFLGFVLVLQGFNLANPKNVSFNEKRIGFVKPGKEIGTVEVREAVYNNEQHMYVAKEKKGSVCNISPNCVLKIFTMGSSYSHSNMPYDWWRNQEEEKLYCIGIDKSIIVYLEEIYDAFELS